MAAITLGTLRDYWKAVKEWVDGTDTTSAPKVTVAATTRSATVKGGATALSTSAATLPDEACVGGAILQNDPSNTIDILIGGSASQPVRLKPGMSMAITVTNLNKIYAKSASGTPSISWITLN